MTTPDPIACFLEGARAVLGAVSDPRVAAAWGAPSVLEEQTVGSLAGHLARGSVWAAGEYLDGGEPDRPADFADAVEYYDGVMTMMGEADHRAVRDRGAAIAAGGPAAVSSELSERLAALEGRLPALPAAQPIAVVAGRVMPVGEYLKTRIVEQCVHLDDLARSVGVDAFPYPEACTDIAVDIAVRLARRRAGDAAFVRALYRRGGADGVLPVL